MTIPDRITPESINIFGLSLDLIGFILIFKFSRIPLLWTFGDVSSEKGRKISFFGASMVVFGFCFQIVSSVMAYCEVLPKIRTVVTSNAANDGHRKTGQWDGPGRW